MKITRNACLADQLVRGAIGIGCSFFGFIDTAYINNSVIAVLVGLFGLLNIFTAITAHCPIYRLAGIHTSPDESQT